MVIFTFFDIVEEIFLTESESSDSSEQLSPTIILAGSDSDTLQPQPMQQQWHSTPQSNPQKCKL